MDFLDARAHHFTIWISTNIGIAGSGKIRMDEAPAVGCCFRFRLPFCSSSRRSIVLLMPLSESLRA